MENVEVANRKSENYKESINLLFSSKYFVTW